MKKIFALIMTVILTISSLSLVACGISSGVKKKQKAEQSFLSEWTKQNGTTIEITEAENGFYRIVNDGSGYSPYIVSSSETNYTYEYVKFAAKANEEIEVKIETVYDNNGKKIVADEICTLSVVQKDYLVLLEDDVEFMSIKIYFISAGNISITTPFLTDKCTEEEKVVSPELTEEIEIEPKNIQKIIDGITLPDYDDVLVGSFVSPIAVSSDNVESITINLITPSGKTNEFTEAITVTETGKYIVQYVFTIDGEEYYRAKYFMVTGNSDKPITPDTGWDGVIEDDCPVPNSERLAVKYKDYFEIGMAVGYDRYTTYSDIDGHYSSVTLENEMKMYTIAPGDTFNYTDPSAYDFSKADEMLTYYRKKGKKIRGHALIWHYEDGSASIGWLSKETNKAEMLKKIDTYCYTVTKHFSEKFGDVIYAWDVVNEAISDNFGGKVCQAVKDVYGNSDDGCNSYRSSAFYNVTGTDYIVTAFKAARRALEDTNTTHIKLFYNDYNIVAENQKLRGVLNLVAEAIEKGAPIDGIGLQSHLKGRIANSEEAITKIIKLGEVLGKDLDIQITELDTENYNHADLTDFYTSVFNLYIKYKDNISAVVMWAVADDYSWLDSNQYRTACPTLFDVNHQKKPAFDAVFNLV